MKEIEKRIFVTEDILLNEWHYLYGDKKDVLLDFVYYNFKKDKETNIGKRTYVENLELARSRRSDGRYKNYEFLIG